MVELEGDRGQEGKSRKQKAEIWKSRTMHRDRDRLKQGLRTGEVEFAGRRLAWRILRRARGFELTRETGREFFDAEKVGSIVRLRHWQAGDRFQPIGLSAATKLQDWFTNRKIPMARRRQLVLAENERGEVFWVEGERIGEGCKVTPATRRVLEWRQVGKAESKK